eukprot:7771505-Ditylum_brightwellii.AAC.1
MAIRDNSLKPFLASTSVVPPVPLPAPACSHQPPPTGLRCCPVLALPCPSLRPCGHPPPVSHPLSAGGPLSPALLPPAWLPAVPPNGGAQRARCRRPPSPHRHMP